MRRMTCEYLGGQSGNTVVSTAPVLLFLANLAGGSDAATLTIYDHASAANNRVAKLQVGANVSEKIPWPAPVPLHNGCYCVGTGTNATYDIFFKTIG